MWQWVLISLALVVAPPTSADRPVAAIYAYGSAQSAIAEHDFEKAVRFLSKALESDPTYWDAHKSMGECLLVLNRPQEALTYLQWWADLRPADPNAKRMVQQAFTRAEALKKTPAPRDPPAAATAIKPGVKASPVASLGDIARQRGSAQLREKGHVYVLAGSGKGDPIPPIPQDAPVGLLDAMRQRADAVFRPRMKAVASSVRQLRALLRRYDDSCRGKRAIHVAEGAGVGVGAGSGRVYDADTGEEVARYRSESAWTARWRTVTSSRNEDTPQCRALASDVDSLLDDVEGAMFGADGELALQPSVYPGIREEVYSRLVQELW